jgi:prevent-host-death family protein
MYTYVMDVAISSLRAHLRDWVRRAREGEEILVTDRGVPVARIVGVETAPIIERLIADGVIERPSQSPRPRATGRKRVKSRRSVSDLVSEQRR